MRDGGAPGVHDLSGGRKHRRNHYGPAAVRSGTRQRGHPAPGPRTESSAAQDESRPAQALIGEDATQAYPLAAGTTSMILSLSKIEVVNHFDFVNAGAEGKVTVSVSSAKLPFDSASWRVVAVAQAFEGRQLIPCDLGSVDARYVKIDFDTNKAGNISGFNLFGMGSLGSPVMSKGSFHVSLRTVSDGAWTPTSASIPPTPRRKSWRTSASTRELKHLACTYEAPAGHLDFYLVDNSGQGERDRCSVGV